MKGGWGPLRNTATNFSLAFGLTRRTFTLDMDQIDAIVEVCRSSAVGRPEIAILSVKRTLR